MRVASPTRVYLPQESSSTMIIERSASVTCMTRHRPASAMYPVLDKPMSQRELRVRLLVLPKRIARRPILTWYEVEIGRRAIDRKSTRLNSSHLVISYAVFCLKKKKH